MSVNGAERVEHDFYRTPTWAIERILQRLRLEPLRILEPAAGDGALLEPLRKRWPDATVDAFDINPRHPAVQPRAFWFDDTPQRYDLVITNPPYSAAEEFVWYGLSRLAVDGRLVLLLRLAFLESQERRALFRRHEPDVYVLSERPSFRHGTTDPKTAYGWFVWRPGLRRSGRIEHL